MGRQMEDNIHNPSIGGQASSAAASNGSSSRDRLLSLMKRKDALEEEINALSAVLDTHGVDMQTSLTTFDGYPRDDIDVAQIRTTRARIIPLVNDMKALMAEIEKALHMYHAEQTGVPEPTASEPAAHNSAINAPQPGPIVEAVFAVVNQVFPSSPAEAAGLKAGDKVKRFGNVGALNHEKLARVATEVQQNENVRSSSLLALTILKLMEGSRLAQRAISVLVTRNTGVGEQDLDLSLTPRRDWGGRGVLGCQLLPL
ncbi:hypothetical protein H072_4689 [Dactylellina haptotyla CBS 200.50]|uniref:Nas2 N-terminal domain-containing protein n=1 Tax=Dactylellina haptotyla (strain CBS 200.50) TaxID=1284197 RepID=S8C1G5_DACHA|nr:hypothetical protein H072_4689 [Dactylellina haptotyla CBS 200.50]